MRDDYVRKLRSRLTASHYPVPAYASAAAGNSYEVTYFEMSKASVAAGLYRVAKHCYLNMYMFFKIALMVFDAKTSHLMNEDNTSRNAADRQVHLH